MDNKRIPREVGKGVLPDHPAIKTPWERLISYHDAYHYVVRHISVIDSAFMQALRILIPDYVKRSKLLCEYNKKNLEQIFSSPYKRIQVENHNIHPFMEGGYIGAIFGDSGDERLCMPGRVNDFGQFRVEKELDACPWDIVGSEFCRCTTSSLEGTGVAFGGPSMEYNMVEAKGCGDLHCRVIAENRDKYPMPEKESWEKFGPIATSDQIKFTPEDKMYKEPQQFRQECDFKYRNGLNAEITHDQLYGGLTHPLGSDMVLNVLYPMIEAKEINKEEIENVIKCVFEASGKMTFGEHFAIKGLRDWLGVPGDVKDGRVLGGYIEVVLQALRAKYDIQNFDKEEVIYDINLAGLERRHPMLTKAYLSMWNGMGKTLIGSQWFVWRETEGVADEILRLKIGKKIDKFC